MTSTSKKLIWSALDHKIWGQRSAWPPFQRLLIALSGGVDSVVLLAVFHKLSQAASFEVRACYVHHGSIHGFSSNLGASDLASTNWRDQAQEKCVKYAQALGVPLVVAGPSLLELSSEESLRDFRYKELRKIQLEYQCDWILTAHHSDDLLETRILRLLRGTGPAGLEALKEWDSGLWRPFLGVSKKEILQYAEQNHLSYLEDPSNLSLDPLRNWVRHELFSFLEARQIGLTQSLSRSLQLLVEVIRDKAAHPLMISEEGEVIFERVYYLSLSLESQRQFLAQALGKAGIKHYTQGQIIEAQKHLDNSQKVHSFSLGTALWSIDAKQVRLSSLK